MASPNSNMVMKARNAEIVRVSAELRFWKAEVTECEKFLSEQSQSDFTARRRQDLQRYKDTVAMLRKKLFELSHDGVVVTVDVHTPLYAPKPQRIATFLSLDVDEDVWALCVPDVLEHGKAGEVENRRALDDADAEASQEEARRRYWEHDNTSTAQWVLMNLGKVFRSGGNIASVL